MTDTGVHLDIIQHIAACLPCRYQLWELALDGLAQAQAAGHDIQSLVDTRG